jgi:hypothetical protein
MDKEAAFALAGIVSCVAVTGTWAANRPSIPNSAIGAKKELLFSDDFEGPEGSKLWHDVVPPFTFENGTLKGTQTRDTSAAPRSASTAS